MKHRLPVSLSVLIALVLVAFGLFYGTLSGFNEDRADVTALLEMENGLMDVLGYRAADGFNLCAVARRHLMAEDDALIALQTASERLRSARALSDCMEADKSLGSAVSAVSARLQETLSFQQSQRDQNYLVMLTADLSNLSSSAAVTTYNAAAEEFNNRLNAPVFGALARLLGVEACPVYQ